MLIALISLTAVFGIAAAVLAGVASRIEPDFDLVIHGLPIYADDQTGAITEATRRSGRLNFYASICAGLTAATGLGAALISLH